MNDIQVSIICNAYNHELYIRDTLESIIKQKTNFEYEVLVHDDASTDKTAEIIREYEKTYPNIIKPIYEVENQYSKKDGSLSKIQYGRVKGKYIALCEGDDYWIDSMKLQRQFDVLEANPEIDICATAAKTEFNGQIVGEIAPALSDKVFTPEEVIAGGGGFVATASLMYRSDIRKSSLPFFRMMNLDYFVQIAGSLRGGMAYISIPTCVYRVATPGSWTVRTNSSTEVANQYHNKICDVLKCLDCDTKGKYNKVIQQVIKNIKFEILYRNHEYNMMCLPEYRDELKKVPFAKRMLIQIGRYCPEGVNYIWNFKKR